MSRLKSLFAGIPWLQDTRTALAVVVMAISVVLLLVAGVSLLRALPAYGKLVSELELTRQALDQALQMQHENPPRLKTRIAVAQATLEDLVSAFPSDEQATEQLDAIYDYAKKAGVRVTKLENLVNKPEEQNQPYYTTRRVLLGATGDLRRLTRFVSLLTQSALPTFQLDGLKIVPSGETYSLSVNIVLYSSPLSSGVTPRPTPHELSTPVSASDLSDQLNQAWQAEDWPQAIELLLRITETYPEDQNARGMLYWAYVNNGYTLLDAGKRDEAIVQFNKALGVDPNGTEAAAGLSEALEAKKGMLRRVPPGGPFA